MRNGAMLAGGHVEAGDDAFVVPEEGKVAGDADRGDVGGTGAVDGGEGEFGSAAVFRAGLQRDHRIVAASFAATAEDQAIDENRRGDGAELENLRLPVFGASREIVAADTVGPTANDQFAARGRFHNAGSGVRSVLAVVGEAARNAPAISAGFGVDGNQRAVLAFLIVGDDDFIVDDDRRCAEAMLAFVGPEIFSPGVAASVVEG